MESNSIVSFNNDSTLKPEYNNVSVHELALHAMRDRCLLLQRRINSLEADNMRYKLDITKTSDCTPHMPLKDDEKFKLHQKIAELTKQKSQLMHHVFMVSCENKNLWNKIASIKRVDKSSKLEHPKQPLLRTNTYIQSTPKTSENYQEKYSESSLEDISLKLINSYIQEKSQLVEQYEQMAQLQDMDEDLLNVDSIGFTFMEDPTTDSLKEIRSHSEKLENFKKELCKQEQDLKFIIGKVEKVLKDGHKCPSCISKNAKTTPSEHKEIETSDSLANWATPADSTTFNDNFSVMNTSAFKKDSQETSEKQTNNLSDKMCPMCGKFFSKDIAFSDFQAHVENHFTGETEPDSIIKNFENQGSVDIN